MLYDQSQLARVYLHAWQVTGNELFRTITEEILDYVVREMLDPDGGFYSTQDADSEGEEGKFFVWTPDEIREVLGSQADEFMAAYGVTPGGTCHGSTGARAASLRRLRTRSFCIAATCASPCLGILALPLRQPTGTHRPQCAAGTAPARP
jgi:uncharacterized protein YyaL (SSP411 family)